MYVILFTSFFIFVSVHISLYYITNITRLIKLSKILMGNLMDCYYYVVVKLIFITQFMQMFYLKLVLFFFCCSIAKFLHE